MEIVKRKKWFFSKLFFSLCLLLFHLKTLSYTNFVRQYAEMLYIQNFSIVLVSTSKKWILQNFGSSLFLSMQMKLFCFPRTYIRIKRIFVRATTVAFLLEQGHRSGWNIVRVRYSLNGKIRLKIKNYFFLLPILVPPPRRHLVLSIT